MPQFQYKARSLNGEMIRGVLEADSPDALEYILNQRGLFSVNVRLRQSAGILPDVTDKSTKRDLALFCRQLSVILHAGVPIIEAVTILARQTEKKSMSSVLEMVADDLQKGRQLSQSMANHPKIFPLFLQNMIQVGEASGTLDEIMDQLAEFYEKEDKVSRKVQNATFYPAILAALTIGVVVLMMIVVLPMFSDVLGGMGGQMPAITVVLMSVSGFITNNLIAILLVIAALIVAFGYYSSTDMGRLRIDSLKLSFPLTRGITIKATTSRFARSMGILLKSGMDILSAMNIMQSLVGNRAIESRLTNATEDIRQGRGIAESLQRLDVFPPMLIHMVSVGERTGELDQMFTRTTGFFDDEVDTAVTRLISLIEPVMIIILALIIAVILVSIFLPMLSIMNRLA